MKLTERAKGLIDPTRELFEKLTHAQKVSLAILGGVVVIALVTLVATSPSGPGMVPITVEPTDDLKQWLMETDIRHEINHVGKLIVPSDHIEMIYERAFSTGYSEQDPDFMDWILGEMSFRDTTDRTERRVKHSNIRNIQNALRRLEGVASATVFVNKNERKFGGRDTISTASVPLTLDKGVDRLPPGVARTAAKMVAAAWTIPLNRVTVSDNKGYTYRVDELAAIAAEGRQGRERELREKLSRAVFESNYAPNEYTLIVDLKVDRSTRTERSKLYDPDNSVSLVHTDFKEKSSSVVPSRMAPGTKENVAAFGTQNSTSDRNDFERTEQSYENSVAEKEETITNPAGEEMNWSILAKVSKPALVKQIREDKRILGIEDWSPTPQELEQAINTELANLQTQLEDFPTAKATAQVKAFIPPPLPAAQPDPYDGVWGFAALHMREIVLATLALLACFLLYRVAKSGLPDLEELPDPVAELSAFLTEKEERDRVAAEEAARRAAEEEPEPTLEWESSDEDLEQLQLLEQISEYAEERPDVAAAVLRLWLNEGSLAAAGEELPNGHD